MNYESFWAADSKGLFLYVIYRRKCLFVVSPSQPLLA
jgi:hypothetical protein